MVIRNLPSITLTEVQVAILFIFSDKIQLHDQFILCIVLQSVIIYEYATCKLGTHQLCHIATTEFIEGLNEYKVGDTIKNKVFISFVLFNQLCWLLLWNLEIQESFKLVGKCIHYSNRSAASILTEYIIHNSSTYDSHWEVNQFIQ